MSKFGNALRFTARSLLPPLAVVAVAICIIRWNAAWPHYLNSDLRRWLLLIENTEQPVDIPSELRQQLEKIGVKLSGSATIARSRYHGVVAEIECSGVRYYVRHHKDHLCVHQEADANSMLVAQVTLSVAFGITFLLTTVQYSFMKDKNGVRLRHALTDWGNFAYSISLLLLGLSSALVWAANKWLFAPLEDPWAYLLGPTMKNLVLLVIAALFIKVDYDLASKERAASYLWKADVAIAISLFLGGLLVVVLGPDLLSVDFLHAYNVGILTFHMILGVVLAAIGTEWGGPSSLVPAASETAHGEVASREAPAVSVARGTKAGRKGDKGFEKRPA